MSTLELMSEVLEHERDVRGRSEGAESPYLLIMVSLICFSRAVAIAASLARALN